VSQHSFQRRTEQRQVILEELRKLYCHPTATDLYEIVRHRLPRISLGTVYRNLDLLARMGTIQKLEMAGAEARFDGDPTRHDHLRCVRCGRVDDVDGGPLDLSPAPHHDFRGYEVLGRRLEFFGVCPACREQTLDPYHQSPEEKTC
jgi:Fur family transcriptional regulator, ferric uptake regulator